MGIVIMKMAFPSRKHPRINTMMITMASMPADVALIPVKEEMI